MSREIMLKLNDNGEWEKYEEPFVSIDCQTEEDFEYIKSAIEKQAPKKVKISINGTTGWNTRCRCPVCDKDLFDNQKYCSECGQKMDWGDGK